jgi:hypothetical protein
MMFGLVTAARQPRVSRLGWAPVFRDARYQAHLRREERSQDLLRQWLSPDQAKQYDSYQRFEVVGSDTGTRYRILRGTSMNIEELAADGYVTRRWCFAPEGTFATGDVMLAQKIALETFELDALDIANHALDIANHDGPQGTGFPRRSFLHMDELCSLVLAFAIFVTLVWSFFQIVF